MQNLDDLVDEIVSAVGQHILNREDYEESNLMIMHSLGMNITGHESYKKSARGQGEFFTLIAAKVKEKNPKLKVSKTYLHNSVLLFESFPDIGKIRAALGENKLNARNALALISGKPAEKEKCDGNCEKCGKKCNK